MSAHTRPRTLPRRVPPPRPSWRTDTANQRGGWMGADKNSSRRRWRLQQDEHSFQHTSPIHYPSWPSPHGHWSATGPRNQQTTFRAKTHQHAQRHGLLLVLHRWDRWPELVRLVTPIRPVDSAGQPGGYSSRTTSVPESLSDFSRPRKKHSQNTTCTERKPYTKPSKTTPNRPRTDQQHHDPKTHESSSSPEANPTSGLHRSDRSHTGQTGQAWAARDEQHPRVNSPKSKPWSPESLHELMQDFGDSRNASWGVHSQVFVHQNLPNQEELKINPATNSSNPRTPKTPKSSPSTHGFGRGIKGKRTTKGSHEFPPSNPQE
jgi:hypothetical protein